MARDDSLGFGAVEEALAAEPFPMDWQEVAYSIGDMEVGDGHGGSMAVRDLLDEIRCDDFRTADEAIGLLRQVVDRRRAAAARENP